MLASRLGTTRAVAGGLALASLLCWVPGSQAAVFTGSATDASNDLSPAGANALPDPPTSFTNVAVKYDDAAGRVDVAYTFDQVPASDQEIHAGVGFGTTRVDGTCSAPFFISLGWRVPADEVMRGESVVEGHSADFAGDVTGNLFTSAGETPWNSTALFEWPGAQQTWNFATTNEALVGLHYNCATAGMSVTDNPTPGDAGPGEDLLESQAFALTPDATGGQHSSSLNHRPSFGGDWPAAQHVEGLPAGCCPIHEHQGSPSSEEGACPSLWQGVHCARGLRGGMREEELFPLELRSPMGLRPVRVQGQGRAHQALRWARCDPALAAQDEVDLSGAQAHGRRCTERC